MTPLQPHPPTDGAAGHRTTDQLIHLESRRQVLQRLVKITHYVERLRQGLESALHLGPVTEGLPPQALALYKTLGTRVRNLSDREVRLRYDALSRKVRVLSAKIVNIVDKLDTFTQTSIDEKALEKINGITDQFRRLAQTTVALQVLLERRGVSVAPTALSIPPEVIQDKINAVKARESDCREKVIDEVRTLQLDVEKLLANPNCQPALRPILEGLLHDLEANRRHIEAGHSIQELPVDMEFVDFSELHFSNVASAATVQPTTEKSIHSKISPHLSADTAKPERPEPQNLPSPTETKYADNPFHRFGKHLLEWLNTPWSTTWKSITRKTRGKHQ